MTPRLLVAPFWRAAENARSTFLQTLRPQLGITKLVTLRYGTWNALFHATSPRAEFFVKVINTRTEGWTRDTSVLERISCHMHRIAVTEPLLLEPPVSDDSGRYVRRCGEFTLVVYHWLKQAHNQTPNETSAQPIGTIRSAAAALCRLHAACGGPPSLPPRSSPPHALPLSRWCASAATYWNSAATREGVRRSSSALQALKQAREESELLTGRGRRLCEAEQSDIHGDFRPANVLVTDGRVSKVLDFDLAHRGCVEEDVAYAALSFAGPRRLVGARDWSCVRAFIDAYAACARIPPDNGRLSLALKLVSLRAMSLSLTADQVRGRFELVAQVLAETLQ